jgi:hypothetical protein
MPESMIIMGNFLGGPDPNDKLLEGLKDQNMEDHANSTGGPRRQGGNGVGSVDLLQRNLVNYS